MITFGTVPIASTASSVAASVVCAVVPMTIILPPPTAVLAEPGRRVANEFTIHHRYAPVTFVPKAFGDLPAVAEKAQRIAKLQSFVCFQPRVTGRSRTCQHALTHAILQLLL